MQLRFLALFAALIFPFLAIAGLPKKGDPSAQDETRRDSCLAVAHYDAQTAFVPLPDYDVHFYTQVIDSLVMLDTIPVSLVNQLNVYRNLTKRTRADLAHVIDSIFESPQVPQSVVNAVNLYLTSMETAWAAPSGFYAHVPLSGSPYPADAFYGHWNTHTPHPMRNNLAQLDSSITLRLVDEAQDCGFEVPFKGVLTSHFGWRWGRSHNGTDIDLEVWDPVVSAFPGVVRVARNYKGYGRVVVVRHYNGLETLYAHLHRFKVKSGDEVDAGQVIGLGGSSGNSTGSHLHFEVRFQGVPINPASMINFRKGSLKQEVIQLERDGAVLAVVRPEDKGHPDLVYEVKKGDYLYKIAHEYGVSVEELCISNGLRKNQPLRVGQKLRLRS